MSTENNFQDFQKGDFVEILTFQESLQSNQGTFDFRQFGVIEDLMSKDGEEILVIVKPKQKRKNLELKFEEISKIDEEFYKNVANYPSEKALKIDQKMEEQTQTSEKIQEETAETAGTSEIPPENQPPFGKFIRNKYGLIENIHYEFNEDGSVNWRKLIPEEFLYPNRSYFERYNRQVPPTIDGLDDNQLCIKLGGIKHLAKIRGFKSVRAEVIKSSQEHSSVKCSIEWMPHYETNFEPTVFEEVASAHTGNTDQMSRKFLESIAFNRAFVRAVRAFLNINIVGDDEIDKSPDTENQDSDFSPNKKLKEVLKSKKSISSFDEFKQLLRDWHKENIYRNSENIKTWNDFEDIPAKDCRILIGLLIES